MADEVQPWQVHYHKMYKIPQSYDYKLLSSWIHVICNKQTYSMYLGVMLDDQLSWSIHITNVANKATRMLTFLKRHLSKCSSNVKASAYLLMVRPLSIDGVCMCCLGSTLSIPSISLGKGSKACSEMGFI